jgi:hypothetical protein
MIPQATRDAAFRWIVDTTECISDEESEQGILGVLAEIACCFLIGIERQAYEALKAISEGEGRDMFRTTEITPCLAELRDTRRKTVVAVLVCADYFNERVESEEMLGMLNLLAGLAVDDSTDEMFQIIAPLVVEAAKQASVWSILEREYPTICPLTEKEWCAVLPA